MVPAGWSHGPIGRAVQNPFAPLANAKPALIWLKILRAISPLAKPTLGSPRQGQSPLAVTCVQNSRSLPILEFGGLPAMMAPLIAPTDTPAIQLGWMPASARAS